MSLQGIRNDQSLPERKVVLKKTADLLREQIAEFPTYVTLEMGKLFKEAKAGGGAQRRYPGLLCRQC
jgi:acyl-CoA reductase-like NAD-dependent aldehyde dehydrogenase